ncbi:MAG: hypothetical protein ACRDXX_21085 [Stackebrandtia sp.]
MSAHTPDLSPNSRRRRPRLRYLAAGAAAIALAAGGSVYALADDAPGPDDSGPVSADGTLCGASFNTEDEYDDGSYEDAFARVDGYYDGLESVRVFYSGLPKDWPGKLKSGDVPITVSFKAQPEDILDGKHDEHLKRWFDEAPDDRDVYWSYFHEPEDNIEDGDFTAEDYRAAWAYLKDMADAADKPNLNATLILMSWTLENEERDWRDYYPGDGVLDVLAWDAYNAILPQDLTGYRSPEEIFGQTVEVNKEVGLPYAIAETGSGLVEGDDGTDRAAWLRDVVEYLAANDAIWVQYFDIDFTSEGHSDYRLRDEPSQQVWREFCSG